jgi:tetratricopeptide (TPR) repeat protein
VANPERLDSQFAEIVASAKESEFGPVHPETIVAKLALGSALRAEDEPHAALEVYEKVLSQQRDIYGPEDWYTVATEHSVAEAHHCLGELDLAEPLQQHVLAIALRLFGDESEQVQSALINLANTLRDLERYEEELPLRVRIVTSTLRSDGVNSFRLWATQSDLSGQCGMLAISNLPIPSMSRFWASNNASAQRKERSSGRNS